MLYRLRNGYPEPFTGGFIRFNNKIYANPTEEQLRAGGYKTLIKAAMPEERDGYYYTGTYSETDTEIIQLWEEHMIEELTEEEA